MTNNSALQFVSQEGVKQSAELVWKSFSTNERWKHALITSGIILVLGFGIYLIPVVHLPFIAYWFAYIPLLIVFVFFMGWRQYQREKALQGAHGTCPNCSKTVTIGLDGSDKIPLRKYCPNCDKPVDITQVE